MRRLIILFASIAVAIFIAGNAFAASTLPAQTVSASGVTVKVTPQSLSDQSWNFEIAFDTHSGALSDDLTKSAVLIAAGGATSPPVSWQGDPPGGHHRKGVLRFKPFAAQPPSIELQIKRPGETVPRSFRWQLK
ncbi:MAG: hypothetical protein ABI583_13055 [Betaproteobacteria bacterium]